MLLPYILWSRKADVWKDHKELITKIWPLLKEPQRNELTRMMSEKGKIEFKWKTQSFVPYYITEQTNAPPTGNGASSDEL